MKNRAEFTDEVRMRELLIEKGVSTSDAHLALELAAHAKQQALETIKAISLNAPSHLNILITALAIDSLAAALSLDEVEEVAIHTLALGILQAAAHAQENAGQDEKAH